MEVVSGVDNLRPEHGRLFVVVGVFDGLHTGHAYLLEHLGQEAGKRDARPGVITFDHHPDEILVGAAPPLLCDPAERLDRLAAAGVELTVVQHFDEALRRTEYDAFVAAIAARTGLAGFLMTPDAAFGFERRGTPEALAELGRRLGFEVAVVPPFELDGRPVRSTDIRNAIAAGDLVTAARLLGRPVAVVGEATPAGSGAQVTFKLPVALPPPGTYTVRAQASGTSHSGRASIADGRLELDRDARGRVRIEFRGEGEPSATR
jgi:riboflavin kinase/FMN adenylyltransferase